MNLVEELRSLDTSDPGRWPLAVRAGAVGLCFVILCAVGSYVFVYDEQVPELQKREDTEQQLRQEFKTKHSKAVNLEIYKQQLKDIERSFGALLRQLPGKFVVPFLLVVFSLSGLSAGLQETLFLSQAEQMLVFFVVLPNKISLTGSYHQFGEFVSGIAALPRIVTLHDIEIRSANKDAYDQLTLDITAKTYRYLDEEEVQANESAARAKRKPGS